MDKIKSMNEVDLRRELVNLGLPTHGSKAELQARLKKYLKEKPDTVLQASKEESLLDEREKKHSGQKPGVSFSVSGGKKSKKIEKEIEAYKDESSESEGEYEISQEVPKEAEEIEKNAFAYNIRENIKRFFKYNKNKLVREKIAGIFLF